MAFDEIITWIYTSMQSLTYKIRNLSFEKLFRNILITPKVTKTFNQMLIYQNYVRYIHKKNWNHNQKTPLTAWRNKAKKLFIISGHSIKVMKSSHKAKICATTHFNHNHQRLPYMIFKHSQTFLASHTIHSSYIYKSFNWLHNREST